MANLIKLKRSAEQGKLPTTAQLNLGELAINTYDGKLYLKKNVQGTESIIDLTVPDSTVILNQLKLVDGTGSGLNADLLDGQHASAFATAAQGTLAGTALQPAAIGTTVQNYSTNLTAWSAITTSTKQDTLISGTNIKTINGSSILGSGNLTISGDTGPQGPAGSDATVTSANIAAALGYTPADAATVAGIETLLEAL